MGNAVDTTTRDANRKALVDAIIEQTRPEKTGQFSFDGFSWSEDGSRLRLNGDFDTPSVTLTFLKKGRVNVCPEGHESWHMTVESTYQDFNKLAMDILATVTVIRIRGGF
jgi:hypothetical protein